MNQLADEARAYLLKALNENDVSLTEASRVLGRSDAYIHQYVTGKKSPLWLSEQDRDALVARFDFLKAERLRPSKVVGRRSMKQVADLSHEEADQEFLGVWGDLDPEIKIAILLIVRAIVQKSRSAP